MVKMTMNELSTDLTAEELLELEAAESREPAESHKANHFPAYFSRNPAESKAVRERLYRPAEPSA